MISLLIAEDEPLERRALLTLIQAEFPGEVEVVAECATGLSTVESALREKPDLILIDIEMPELNGLEALERIRAGGVLPEAVILTAYGRFSYAQQAIRLGANDYLLKPVSRSKLKATIVSLIDRIETRKSLAVNTEEKDRLLQASRGTLERELLWQLRHPGPATTRALADLAGLLRLPKASYLHLSVPPRVCHDAGSFLFERIGNRLSSRGFRSFGAIFGGHLEFLIQLSSDECASAPEVVTRTVRDLCPTDAEAVRIAGPTDTLAALSQTVVSREAYAHGAQETRELSRFKAEQRLCDVIVTGDVTEISRSVRQLFQDRSDGPFSLADARSYAAEIATVVDRRLLTLFARRFPEIHPRTLGEAVASLVTVDEIVEVLEVSLERSVSQATTAPRSRRERVVELVKQSLESRLSEAFSLTELSDELRLSPSYISRSFKEETGMTFKEFQMMYRMQRAKELLQSPGVTVRDAAEAVGFSDPNYFSKAFKKEVGVSPRSYAGA